MNYSNPPTPKVDVDYLASNEEKIAKLFRVVAIILLLMVIHHLRLWVLHLILGYL